MLLYDWKKIYKEAKGNIHKCNSFMKMIIKVEFPENKFDPLYGYTPYQFVGQDFLLHADMVLYNAYKYTDKELAIYYALAAIRPLSDYFARGKLTLDLPHCPVEIDTIKNNRLLHIDSTEIHFIYEEVTFTETIH